MKDSLSTRFKTLAQNKYLLVENYVFGLLTPYTHTVVLILFIHTIHNSQPMIHPYRLTIFNSLQYSRTVHYLPLLFTGKFILITLFELDQTCSRFMHTIVDKKQIFLAYDYQSILNEKIKHH